MSSWSQSSSTLENTKMPETKIRRAVTVVAVAVALLLSGCASGPVPNRNPTGEMFPSVAGESLTGGRVELPDALAGEPAVLLIGYVQEAQFDIDRWLMGLVQAGTAARVLELPTIPDLVPTIASDWIDDGMRSGIPEEDWGVVVKLYGSAAEPVAALTGTTNGRLPRVLLLDAGGKVVWFHDRGYSAAKAMELAEAAARLTGNAPSD
jgi:hypothetical protein